MSVLYVPVVPPTPPSHQARELAEQLQKVISDYEAAHPSVSAREIRYALMLAQRGSTRVGVRAGLLATSVAIGIGVLAAVFADGSGSHGGATLPTLAIIAVLFLVAVVAILMRRRP